MSEARLIFVVGNSRSGTTMMGRLLGGHAHVFTFHELHFFEQLWSSKDRGVVLDAPAAADLAAELLSIQRDGYLGRRNPAVYGQEAAMLVATLPAGGVTALDVFEGFLRYEAARHGKTIPCDQTPRHLFYIGDILEAYPQARIINMVRDPRDVLLSQKNKWKRRFRGARNIPLREAFRSWINYHPFVISKLWNAAMKAAEGFTGHARVYSLHFETLLAQPEASVRAVCDFVGLPFEAAMLEIPQIGSSNRDDAPGRMGIDPQRSGRWQQGGLSRNEIYICQRTTTPYMAGHPYEPAAVRPQWLTLGLQTAAFPLKLGVSFLLNLRRMRNIKETLKKRFT